MCTQEASLNLNHKHYTGTVITSAIFAWSAYWLQWHLDQKGQSYYFVSAKNLLYVGNVFSEKLLKKVKASVDRLGTWERVEEMNID